MRFIVLFLLSFSVFANDEIEINALVQDGGLSVGTRQYIDLDYSASIIRYDTDKHRVEHRNLLKGTKREYWYRYQYKLWKSDGLSFTPRIEFRERERKSNIWRFRPVLGYKNDYFWIQLHPQWQYTPRTGEAGFHHTESQIGVTYKYKSLKVEPFIQVNTDTSFKETDTFLGVNLAIKLK